MKIMVEQKKVVARNALCSKTEFDQFTKVRHANAESEIRKVCRTKQ